MPTACSDSTVRVNDRRTKMASTLHMQYTERNFSPTKWTIRWKKTHLVITESMYTNFSPSVPSSFAGTEERKLRRSLFFSDGRVTCIQRPTTFCTSETDVGRRQKSRKTRTNIVQRRWFNVIVKYVSKK